MNKLCFNIGLLLFTIMLNAQTKVGIGTNNPQKMLSINEGINLDQANAGNGSNLAYGLSFGFSAQTGIASDRSSLSFMVNNVKRLFIASDGNIGMGGAAPNNALLQMDHLGKYDGYDFDFDAHAIMIRTPYSNPFVTGKYAQILKIGLDTARRLSYINADSANYFANGGSTLMLQSRFGGKVTIGPIFSPTNRLEVDGSARLVNNLIVQGNKGIIRSDDTTQQKEVVTAVLMNYSSTPIPADGSVFKDISWAEPFSKTPHAYVGNFTGSGGWAESVVSVSGVSATGCRVWLYNPRPAANTPNFTVQIIAIGPQ